MQSACGSGEGQSFKPNNKPFKQRESASGTVARYPIRIFPDEPLAKHKGITTRRCLEEVWSKSKRGLVAALRG